ncbi:hypothetical protein BH09PLA1_BH09PLA1_16220 [soil metagenome]
MLGAGGFVVIGVVTNVRGQPPGFSIVSSISFIRRIVSFNATTIFW